MKAMKRGILSSACTRQSCMHNAELRANEQIPGGSIFSATEVAARGKDNVRLLSIASVMAKQDKKRIKRFEALEVYSKDAT